MVFYGVDGAPRPSRDAVLGATSMIIWILTWLLVLKYTFVVLHADDNGQGAARSSGSSPAAGAQVHLRRAARRRQRAGCGTIIWILTWLLVLKYTFVVLQADDYGQGAAQSSGLPPG